MPFACVSWRRFAASPEVGTRIVAYQLTARALVANAAPTAPDPVSETAVVAICNYFNDRPSAPGGKRWADIFSNCGAASMLAPWMPIDVTMLDFVNDVEAPDDVPDPDPFPTTPTAYDLRFGYSHDDIFTPEDFLQSHGRLGDTRQGVRNTAILSNGYVGIWCPATITVARILRDSLLLSLFVPAPPAQTEANRLMLGSEDGYFYPSRIRFNGLSAGHWGVELV